MASKFTGDVTTGGMKKGKGQQKTTNISTSKRYGGTRSNFQFFFI